MTDLPPPWDGISPLPPSNPNASTAPGDGFVDVHYGTNAPGDSGSSITSTSLGPASQAGNPAPPTPPPPSPAPPGSTQTPTPPTPAPPPQAGVYMGVNGAPMAGITEFNIVKNNYLAPDTFSAVIALDATGQGASAPYWATQDSIEVNLQVNINGSKTTSLLIGLVDDVEIDLAAQTLHIRGRDYISVFVDAKTNEKFLNQTSSEIVTTLCSRHGITCNVKQTTTPIAKYYKNEAASVTNQQTEWQLISFLAQKEKFNVYMSGVTLNFLPVADITKAQPYILRYDSSGSFPILNAESLTLRRTLTIAKDVVVKVNSWNHEQKQHVKAGRQKTKIASKSPTAKASVHPTRTNKTPLVYEFREPGLTQEQANDLAEKKLAELTQHERKIEARLPADLAIYPQSIIQLIGTGTDFDQRYYVSEITIKCGFDTGYYMTVEAKNSSPQTVSDVDGALT